jgi:hypothetical protein
MSRASDLKKLGCSPAVVDGLVQAKVALGRIKRSRQWQDWVQVGAAIEEAHDDMMRRLRLNSENGSSHNGPWGEILRASGFAEIPSHDRVALRDCLRNLEAITLWRESLEELVQQRYNHPRRVLEHWRAHLNPDKDPLDDLLSDPLEGDPEDAEAFDLRPRQKRRNGRRDQVQLELQLQLDAAYKRIEDKEKIIDMLEEQITDLKKRLALFEEPAGAK